MLTTRPNRLNHSSIQKTLFSTLLLLSLLLSITIAAHGHPIPPTQAEGVGTNSESKARELVFASWDEDLDKLKSLLSEGADINSKVGPGLTALHCAKLRGNSDILEWLLDNGAKPKIEMPAKSQIADVIFKRNADPDSPGGAMGVVRNGSIVHKSSYGLANLEHKIPITSTTVFNLASVRKQFVGFAISTLAQQGKISFEDDIRKYIPELHDFGRPISVAHLLQHTSGLRDWPGTLCLSGWSLDDVITPDHMLSMAFNQRGLNFEPGSEHLYSNTGYTLLGELVQRVTGQTLPEWAESNIFQPVGMTSTHFRDDHTEFVPGKAYGYSLDKDSGFHALPDNLTGSLHSSVEDLAKWVTNLETHKVGGESLFELMYQQGKLNNGEKIPYASGLDITEYRGARTIGHGGGWSGFTTFLLYFPEHHFSAIVLYNINTDVTKSIHDISDVFLGERLAQKKVNDQAKKKTQQVKVPDEMLDRYIGTYKVFPAWYITISRDGSQLMVLETNKEKYPVSAISETEFPVDTWNTSIKFNIGDSSQVSDFDFLGITCPKVEEGPKPSISPLTEDMTGVYYSDELDARYTIAIENDKLVVKHRRHGTFDLTPAWKDNFRGELWFMRSVEFNRDKKGFVEGLTVTQWQSRNHQFVKLEAN